MRRVRVSPTSQRPRSQPSVRLIDVYSFLFPFFRIILLLIKKNIYKLSIYYYK
ncbi:unnamed protein product [Leptidea sinapis]|uniref:Uncharacterized protein n=1 Tax=Leptidea sinapis TaxID=189913 RepID=A0A5E4QJB5_9NEOP|nr:unnamed protein product [Leptidea sinapis]